jgi:hypothetical protein
VERFAILTKILELTPSGMDDRGTCPPLFQIYNIDTEILIREWLCFPQLPSRTVECKEAGINTVPLVLMTISLNQTFGLGSNFYVVPSLFCLFKSLGVSLAF